MMLLPMAADSKHRKGRSGNRIDDEYLSNNAGDLPVKATGWPNVRTSSFQGLAVLCAGLLIFSFWWLRREYSLALDSFARITDSTLRPILMPGAPLTLSAGYVQTEASETSDFAAPAGNKVVFVYDTTCPACQAQFPVWSEIVPALPLGENDEVLFIAFPDSRDALRPLIEALIAKDIRYRLLEVEDKTVFIATSGIGYFPIVMLLDSEDRIRLIVNELTDELVSSFTRLLTSPSAVGSKGGVQ